MTDDRNHPLTWLWNKRPKPLFSQAMVLELAPSVTPTTLQNWANREIISAIIRGGDVRGRRYYDAQQLTCVAIGSKLIDSFSLPPSDAMLMTLQGSAKMVATWAKDAVAGATHDEEIMPVDIDWLSDYWIVFGQEKLSAVAVRSEALGEAIRKVGLSFVWPLGRELLDLSVRAKAVYNKSAA
jgi:hypothetical protein